MDRDPQPGPAEAADAYSGMLAQHQRTRGRQPQHPLHELHATLAAGLPLRSGCLGPLSAGHSLDAGVVSRQGMGIPRRDIAFCVAAVVGQQYVTGGSVQLCVAVGTDARCAVDCLQDTARLTVVAADGTRDVLHRTGARRLRPPRGARACALVPDVSRRPQDNAAH